MNGYVWEYPLSPNSTGRGQNWPRQLTSNFRQTSHTSDFKKVTFLQKRLPNLFELLTWPQKMMFWCPFWPFFVRSSVTTRPCGPPASVGFTVITDHPSAGEVLLGCGPQFGAVPVNILISFWSWAAKSAGGGGFSVGPALSLFLSVLMLLQRSGRISKIAAPYYTPAKERYSF